MAVSADDDGQAGTLGQGVLGQQQPDCGGVTAAHGGRIY